MEKLKQYKIYKKIKSIKGRSWRISMKKLLEKSKYRSTRWLLVFYDFLILCGTVCFMLVFYRGAHLGPMGIVKHIVVASVLIYCSRSVFQIYQQIWRYGGIQCYMRLIMADACAALLYCVLEALVMEVHIQFPVIVSICSVNLLASLVVRMLYRYLYKYCSEDTVLGKVISMIMRCLAGCNIQFDKHDTGKGIPVAIIGAGRIGTMLAEGFINNQRSYYVPTVFIEIEKSKIGRTIHNIIVLDEADVTKEVLEEYGIQEIIFAIGNQSGMQKEELYEKYKAFHLKLKVYDYPVMEQVGEKKPRLREFSIEDILFRKSVEVIDAQTRKYYSNKTVLITGGGGSIGSELCKQLASMSPKQLVILDVYENGAYDIQQELKMQYGNELQLQVEILSVCNYQALEHVFQTYRPQIVINAAAHKHVPLMEHNCVEAVENNIFGTWNTMELCKQYEVEHFMMVSTDKAVNPTNVMGATKRMGEMLVLANSREDTNTVFTATRFGNVLGSAGSVIPLFKRQIAKGGPITLTDKRIIRYFMTIPEASQLVLQSGEMAKNGEIYVLDMGQPVKIYDLAKKLIQLSGLEINRDIEIIETGLRPGEKLYEELLVKSEELEKTHNSMIFVEHGQALSMEEVQEKLQKLQAAVALGDDDYVREVLHEVIPDYKTPEEVNVTYNKNDHDIWESKERKQEPEMEYQPEYRDEAVVS